MKVKNSEGQVIEVDVFIEQKKTKGRPQKILSENGLKMVEDLSRIFCTDKEIADILGTTLDVLHSPQNNELFLSAKERGQSNGKQSLRRKEYELAMKGNVTMVIWLAKQFLGQKERTEVEMSNESVDTMNDYLEMMKSGKQCKD